MFKITKDEVLKLANISRITLREDEVDTLIEQLESVLEYAISVKELSGDVDIPSSQKINVYREDAVVRTDPKQILEQAPESDDNYFVVPTILEV